jgi:tripartite-type tricarboxylate transporter receptor subunit TctC
LRNQGSSVVRPLRDKKLQQQTGKVLVGLFAILLGAFASPALAQSDYPSKSIRVVVPFPAGGTTDMLARLVTQKMGESMGQSFVVENVGGAGGSIGADQIAKAAPDGYSLLFHNLTFSTTTSSLQYAGRSRHDIEKDFVPISVGAYVPMLLMVHPSVPAKDMKEFVAIAKASKDPMFYGSTGPGSVMNYSGELLKRDAQIKLDHIPFKGAAPLVTELLSGRIQFGGDQLSTSLQREIRRAAAARGAERDPLSGLARCADSARAGFRLPGIAGLERLLRAGRNAGCDRAASAQGSCGGFQESGRARENGDGRRRARRLHPGRNAGDAARASRQGEAGN